MRCGMSAFDASWVWLPDVQMLQQNLKALPLVCAIQISQKLRRQGQ